MTNTFENMTREELLTHLDIGKAQYEMLHGKLDNTRNVLETAIADYAILRKENRDLSERLGKRCTLYDQLRNWYDESLRNSLELHEKRAELQKRLDQIDAAYDELREWHNEMWQSNVELGIENANLKCRIARDTEQTDKMRDAIVEILRAPNKTRPKWVWDNLRKSIEESE